MKGCRMDSSVAAADIKHSINKVIAVALLLNSRANVEKIQMITATIFNLLYPSIV
jgi:hypothetical protein